MTWQMYGNEKYDEGKAEPASDHAPIYLRKSQAERELEAKGKKLEE